jgi:hypothetical integral membrane protein (TIGR02206 family)
MQALADLFFGDYTGFQPFSISHLIPIIFFVVSTILWIRVARNWNEERQFQSAFLFSLSLAFAVLLWMFHKKYTGKFDIREDLPFHLCDILTLVIPVALYYRSRWFFAVLYFWVLAGTLQAVITPDLKQPFPHFMYFRYWWIHCGMISLVIFCLATFRWQIYFRDIKNAMIGANVYLVFSVGINLITDGNYFFVMRKPDAVTLLDFLGPWPWYLITAQLVMLVSFLIYYLPVYWLQKKRQLIEN